MERGGRLLILLVSRDGRDEGGNQLELVRVEGGGKGVCKRSHNRSDSVHLKY